MWIISLLYFRVHFRVKGSDKYLKLKIEGAAGRLPHYPHSLVRKRHGWTLVPSALSPICLHSFHHERSTPVYTVLEHVLVDLLVHVCVLLVCIYVYVFAYTYDIHMYILNSLMSGWLGIPLLMSRWLSLQYICLPMSVRLGISHTSRCLCDSVYCTSPMSVWLGPMSVWLGILYFSDVWVTRYIFSDV
jgi:hypothetical protein